MSVHTIATQSALTIVSFMQSVSFVHFLTAMTQWPQTRTKTVSGEVTFSEIIAPNSALVTQQLTDGVRMLQMQAHSNSGDIYLCHTACVSARTIRHAVLPEPETGTV